MDVVILVINLNAFWTLEAPSEIEFLAYLEIVLKTLTGVRGGREGHKTETGDYIIPVMTKNLVSSRRGDRQNNTTK